MVRLLQVFLLIGRTSALTMSVGGVVKDWLLVGLGVAMYNSPVTRLNLEGYAVTFLSVRFRCRRYRLRRQNAKCHTARLGCSFSNLDVLFCCACAAHLLQGSGSGRVLLLPAQVLLYNVAKIYTAQKQAQQAAAAAALSRMSRAPSEEGLALVERHTGVDRI